MFGLIGKKVGMTQVFTADGVRHPVTVVEVPKSRVIQIKDESTDGYKALQIGCYPKKAKHTTRPMAGHVKKAGVETSFEAIKEFRMDDVSNYEVGQELGLEQFAKGDVLAVTGTSKGRGFTGVIRRHNFHGGPGGHGSRFHRVPGSIGMHTDPGRVFKNRKMPGQHGNARTTVRDLVVMAVDVEKELLFVRGAIPGPKTGLVYLQQMIKLGGKLPTGQD